MDANLRDRKEIKNAREVSGTRGTADAQCKRSSCLIHVDNNVSTA